MSADDRSKVGKVVRSFYESCSFPGYDEYDTLEELVRKAEQGIYANLLNQQLPLDVRILDAGCGTGQLANFLSIAHRNVTGIDFSFSSLSKGNKFKKDFQLSDVSFAQMDLFHLGLQEGSFDYVFCNGVLHHTADAYGAFQNLCRLLKPGGYITIGLYNTYGRLFLDFRRGIFRLTRGKLLWLDFFMRQKSLGDEKRRIWYMDQYRHPHEDKFTVDDVLKWFRANGIEYVNSVPKIKVGDEFTDGEKLFGPHDPGDRLDHVLSQIGWIFTKGKEGGFYLTIGRKKQR